MGKIMRSAVLILVVLAGITATVSAESWGQLNAAETWIVQQVAAGQVADLKEKFGPEEKSRQVRAAFLAGLLTNEIPGARVHRRGVAIRHAVFPDYVNLQSAEVPHAVELLSCRFPGGLNLSYSRFKKFLSLDQSHIGGWAWFNGLQVESDASFNDAVFAAGVFFEGAAVVGRLHARGARFEHQDLGANFANLQVGHDADFHKAFFQGDTFFSRIRVKGNFSIFQAQFAKSVFFEGSDIGGDFNGISAQCHHPQVPVYFTNMKVGQRGFFTNLACPAGVSMAMAHFQDLYLGSTTDQPVRYRTLVLDYAVADRVVTLKNMELDRLDAKKFQGKDLVLFDNVRITDAAHLEGSSWQTLLLVQMQWPRATDRVWLDDMTYQTISQREKVEAEGPDDWRNLVNLVNHSSFNTQNYVQLEAHFQRRGEKDRADHVYIQGKRRETLEKWWRPGNLATLVFWDGLAGYGKKPARTLWVSLIIIFIGTLFFDHNNFDPSFLGGWSWLLQGDPKKTAVVRFFLSMDEFLPGVDLGLAKLWQISKISFPTLLYYHFHKIAGWILIPIGLAAVYTQFR